MDSNHDGRTPALWRTHLARLRKSGLSALLAEVGDLDALGRVLASPEYNLVIDPDEPNEISPGSPKIWLLVIAYHLLHYASLAAEILASDREPQRAQNLARLWIEIRRYLADAARFDAGSLASFLVWLARSR